MKVQVKFLGGEVGKGEKVLLLFLPLATKHWNLSRSIKHWSFSRATKHWSFSRATKHWSFSSATEHWNLPLATELGSSFTSFFFLLFKRANSYHLELSLGEDNFRFKS
jgi:hypothetical protein